MKRRYATQSMQKIYDSCIEAYRNESSELFLPDGSQHRGALHRCAFWDGFNGKPRRPHGLPGTLAGACYSAGRDIARGTA